MPRLSSTPWTALVVGLLAASPAAAQELPEDATAWGRRIKAAYDHYDEVTFQFLPDAPAAPPCPSAQTRPPPEGAPGLDPALRERLLSSPAEVEKACKQLAFRSWMLRADLKPADQRVFAAGWIRVVALPEGDDAVARVQRMAADGAIASKAIQLVAPAGRFLVDLHLPCGATGLARYEAADLLAVLAEEPTFDVPVVAMSACGRTWFSVEEADAIRQRATEPAEYWGLPFPESRDRARARAAEPAEDADPAE